MKQKTLPKYIVLYVFLFIGLWSCEKKEDLLEARIDTTLNRGLEQYKFMKEKLPEDRFPKTYYKDTDILETSDSRWWCSGFYPGSLLLMSEALKVKDVDSEIERILKVLEKEQYNKSTHDLGFMMYCSFGNANLITPKPEYESILMNSAKSLITRYNDTVQCIRSWDNAWWNKAGEGDLVVIIDNMMNLELLFWASKHSGDSTYSDIAIKHANQTIKNHYRDDYSSFHEVIYDEETGKVKAQITNQGAADSSSWARGQAWGLYGFVVMYRETKDEKYLKQAENIANYLLKHPNLPEDMIPYWDFNAPNIPDELRDSSAAAIIASALLELSEYSDTMMSSRFNSAATTILENLLTPEYIAEAGTNGGFILKHGVGNMPNKTEVDTPLSYGDYYLIEAMLRYKNLKI